MEEFEFLEQSPWLVAPLLLGCHLVRKIDGQLIVGRIVETEAYDQADAASHSYHGQTPRTAVMFGPAGHAYVYFTYGMHYCLNVVCGPVGHGSAVLIRAIEPLKGLNMIKSKRPKIDSKLQLTNGPAKLCQALGINRADNGHDLAELSLQLIIKPALPAKNIQRARRIGISRDTDRLWRYYIKQNPYVSRY